MIISLIPFNTLYYVHVNIAAIKSELLQLHRTPIPTLRNFVKNVIYNPRFVYFLPTLVLCMVSIQERFLIKSGLYLRAYGN